MIRFHALISILGRSAATEVLVKTGFVTVVAYCLVAATTARR